MFAALDDLRLSSLRTFFEENCLRVIVLFLVTFYFNGKIITQVLEIGSVVEFSAQLAENACVTSLRGFLVQVLHLP